MLLYKVIRKLNLRLTQQFRCNQLWANIGVKCLILSKIAHMAVFLNWISNSTTKHKLTLQSVWPRASFCLSEAKYRKINEQMKNKLKIWTTLGVFTKRRLIFCCTSHLYSVKSFGKSSHVNYRNSLNEEKEQNVSTSKNAVFIYTHKN